MSRNLRQSGSESEQCFRQFGNLGETYYILDSVESYKTFWAINVYSHLVEVDKVDIQRLIGLACLQQILILVLVLGKKDETDGLEDYADEMVCT